MFLVSSLLCSWNPNTRNGRTNFGMGLSFSMNLNKFTPRRYAQRLTYYMLTLIGMSGGVSPR